MKLDKIKQFNNTLKELEEKEVDLLELYIFNKINIFIINNDIKLTSDDCLFMVLAIKEEYYKDDNPDTIDELVFMYLNNDFEII